MNNKLKNIVIGVLSLTAFTSAYSQSILDDYFNGNRDSLVVEATKLIFLPEPTFKPESQNVEADPAVFAEMGFEQVYKTENYTFTTRDNTEIFAYKSPSSSQNTIILIHGVASSAYLYNKTAGLLQKATQAEIYAIDIRGHGQSEGSIGDVDYINQYADDLADIVKAIRKEKPNGKIIIAGHSMGGGISLRYAMMQNKEKVDGFILFAPLIGHNSPAIVQETQIEKDTISEPFVKIHFGRIIGLKMLNEIGNHEHDSLPVLFFNLPESIPLRKYTYRANMSMAPDNYVDGLKSIDVSMLVLVGSEDEVFNAEALQKAILENSTGKIKIIQDVTHNGIRHNKQSFEFIKHWYTEL